MLLYSRYLLSTYLKAWGITCLTVCTLIFLSQMTEIARFAALGVPWAVFGKFLYYQLPLLLWIALPLSSLVGGALAVRRLSAQGEITALRGLGFSLPRLLTPMLVLNCFFAVGTFYTHSELATRACRQCRELVTAVTAINPIVMLQHSAAMQLEGAFVQMDSVVPGRAVAHVIIALPLKQTALCLADHLKIVDGELQGSDVTWITTLPQAEGFDPLIIERTRDCSSPATELATLLRTKGWRLSNDYLNWRHLCARERQLLQREQNEWTARKLRQCRAEKGIRVAVAMTPVTFTLLACAYSLFSSRRQDRYAFLMMSITAAVILFGIIVSKKLHSYPPLFICAVLLLPQLYAIGVSLWRLRNIHRGYT